MPAGHANTWTEHTSHLLHLLQCILQVIDHGKTLEQILGWKSILSRQPASHYSPPVEIETYLSPIQSIKVHLEVLVIGYLIFQNVRQGRSLERGSQLMHLDFTILRVQAVSSEIRAPGVRLVFKEVDIVLSIVDLVLDLVPKAVVVGVLPQCLHVLEYLV